MNGNASVLRQTRRRAALKLARRNYFLYIFLLPAVVYIAVFSYGPLYGIQIAFKNFAPAVGIWQSPWSGLNWFEMFFKAPRFWQILRNTLSLSAYTLLAGFPIPILLALVINSISNVKLRRISQTITYMPYFISTVVLVGMISVFFSPRSGFVNTILKAFGGPGNTYFLGIQKYFRHLYVWSGIWQSAGWNSIIYIAALTSVSPELHESAVIDGASKLRRIWHIDIPTIMPTMVILLVLNSGSLMNVGFEKVFLMQNSLNLQVSEIISTYTYKMGITKFEYSYSAAIGLFNNVISFVILLLVNRSAKALSGSSLW